MTNHDDNSIFFKRHSRRSYLDKEIPSDALDRIFEIVRWSPSCSNKQPWRFIFVKDAFQKEKFMSALPRGNQWAAKAPVLVAVCARPEDDYVREDDPVQYSQLDSGMAVMSLLLAAVDEGLMAHPMAGYSAPGIKEALEIPDDYSVLCVISLGYEGTLDMLNERARSGDEATRTRKETSEIIAIDKFSF